MAGYGYSTPSYGYSAPAIPKPRRSLAHAAAGGLGGGVPSASDPFGLSTLPTAGHAVIPELGGSPQPRTSPALASPAPANAATRPVVVPQEKPTAQVATSFDINTDPALQQVNALTGLSDEQARAQALKERQQTILDYGSPELAGALFGANDPFVAAAKGNPSSTLAQLARGREQNLGDFTRALDPSLLFSGYRAGQEKRLGQAYTDQLAQAASGVNQTLDQIAAQLSGALHGNALERAQALAAARDRAAAQAAANPPQTDTTPGGGGLGGGTGATGGVGDTGTGTTLEGSGLGLGGLAGGPPATPAILAPGIDPRKALALAAAARAGVGL